MKLVSRTALAVMLAFSAASMAEAPAAARDDQEQAEAPKLDLSRKAAKLLGEVQEAQQAGDNAAALAKLKEAEAVLKTSDDRYMANAMKLNVAIATKDDALLEEALKGALASGSAQIG